jgi:hypothetical protein
MRENENKKKQSEVPRSRFSHSLCFVIPTGFEPVTYCLEGSCSIQLSYGTLVNKKGDDFHHPLVGVAGFEPATSCSQSRRDNRATLHPEEITPRYLIHYFNWTASRTFVSKAGAKVKL